MSTSHFPIFHLVSPSCRSPQEGQALPLHPAVPERKSHGALLEQGPAPCFRQAKAQKEQGVCSGHTRELQKWVSLQLLSIGKTVGLAASWQSLTLPSGWTLCLLTSAVYHTGAFGRQTRKIHDLHEVVGRKRPIDGAGLGLSCFFLTLGQDGKGGKGRPSAGWLCS